MIEDLAITLINKSDRTLTTLNVVVSFLGFVFALWLRRNSSWSLHRAPFFCYGATIFISISILELSSLATFEAINHGVLWILLSAWTLASIAFGFAYGVISHARSISAYGNGRSAWLAFVPLANLVLIFKPPHEKGGTSTILGWIKSFLIVILGLILFGLGQGVRDSGEAMLESTIEREEADERMQSRALEAILRTQGLEATLNEMAKDVPPQRIDKATMLTKVEAIGETLKYFYEVEMDFIELPESVRYKTIKKNCSSEAIASIVKAGAIIEHFYSLHDGRELGTVTITKEECQNLESATQIKKAPEQDNSDTHFATGMSYYLPNSNNQNFAEAKKWFLLAAEQGNPKAQAILGMMYAEGKGSSQDYTQAIFWYRKAAEQGEDNAQVRLGMLYDEGLGVPRDYTEAVFWYRKAAENGNVFAQKALGLMYEEGLGLEQNYALASHWYRKAAIQGDAVAQGFLGSLYSLGKGVPMDFIEAYAWLNIASMQQNELSKEFELMRYLVEKKLSDSDLIEAQELSKDYFTRYASTSAK